MIEARKVRTDGNGYQSIPKETAKQGCGYPVEFCEYCWINEQFEIIAKSCPNCSIPLCSCQECKTQSDLMKIIEAEGRLYPEPCEGLNIVGMCHKCRKIQFLTDDALVRHEITPLLPVSESIWEAKRL